MGTTARKPLPQGVSGIHSHYAATMQPLCSHYIVYMCPIFPWTLSESDSSLPERLVRQRNIFAARLNILAATLEQ